MFLKTVTTFYSQGFCQNLLSRVVLRESVDIGCIQLARAGYHTGFVLIHPVSESGPCKLKGHIRMFLVFLIW